MRLGSLEIRRRDPDTFTAATLLRAYRSSDEPARSLVCLAALALCCEGPKDWPRYQLGMDYDAHGLRVRGYLEANGAPTLRAVAIGMAAIERIAREPGGVTDAEVTEAMDFFGIAPTGSPAAASPSDTPETPSEG